MRYALAITVCLIAVANLLKAGMELATADSAIDNNDKLCIFGFFLWRLFCAALFVVVAFYLWTGQG